MPLLPETPPVCLIVKFPLSMKVPFLDLKAHHAPLRGHFKSAIADVIDSGIFAGGPAVADLDPILKFGRQHGIPVIEDAAQAHGAEYKGRQAGSIGQIGCFSFYPGKNLGALGEAGAIVTNNLELADKIRILRDHGQARKYHHTIVGWNCRMDAIQGACLAIKLRHLDRGNDLRRTHAARYSAAFKEVEEVISPLDAEYARHVYHIYAIRVQDRDEVMRRLERKGIGCGVH